MKSEEQPHAISRCGAKTRSGKPCQLWPVKGRYRCRMHGGLSPGAPKGNSNAWKHGHYSADSIAMRKRFKKLLKILKENPALMP